MNKHLKNLLEECGLSPEIPPCRAKWKCFLQKLESFADPSSSSTAVADSGRRDRLIGGRWIDALLRVVPDLIFYIDETGTYLDVISENKEAMLIKPRHRLIGKRIADFFPEKDAESFVETIRKAIHENRPQIITYTLKRPDRETIAHYEARIVPTHIREGGKETVVAIVRDVTMEKRSTDYLQIISKIFKDATEGMLIVSLDNSFTEVNDAFCHMLGISRDELPGNYLEDYRNFFEPEAFHRIRQKVRQEGFYSGEVMIVQADGSHRLAWITFDTIFDDQAQAIYRFVILTDISELKKAREELNYRATHDLLTDLPNRMMLMERLGKALESAGKNQSKGALLFIDLDNFKTINDSSGHHLGDRVLVECSRRIQSVLRKEDTLGRFGGDEFLLICQSVTDPEIPEEIAQKIIETLNRPVFVNGKHYQVGASIGMVCFPYEDREVQELVRCADQAMYRAKKLGKNRYVRYDQKDKGPK